ncbi:putative ribonuclease H-like domain-containing protein [Tanacetum coccineum]
MDKCKIRLGYNIVQPPYTRNFMPPKSNLVYPSLDDFVDVNDTVSESVVEKPTVKTNEPETARKENGAPIIEDWVSDSDEENVPKVKTVKMFNKPSFAKINFVKSTEQVKSPRKTSVDKNRQNTPKGNPQQDLKNKVVIDSGCFRHMTGNRSYLTDYEEIDGGFVAFGDFKLTDESHVLLKVPRKDNMYSVDLKNVVPQGGRKPALSFMRPFGCPITILNTIDQLGKFDGKADEGFFVGYSTNSKAFRVFNSRTKKVEENLHVKFSENTYTIAGVDLSACVIDDTNKFYELIYARCCMNESKWLIADTKCHVTRPVKLNGGTVRGNRLHIATIMTQDPTFYSLFKDSPDAGFKPSREEEKKDAEDLRNESGNLTEGKDSEVPSTKELRINQEKDDYINSTNNINIASDGNSTNNVNAVRSTVNATGIEVNVVDPKTSIELPNDLNMPKLEDIVYSNDDEDVGAEADMNNLDAFMHVSPIPTTRIHKDHPVEQIIKDLNSTPQTRRMTKNLKEHGLFSSVQQRTNHKDFQNCLFACFLSQKEPKKVWELVGFTKWETGSYGTKWVYKIKKVEGMDVKGAFIYGKIEEEVYVCQPPGFGDPDFLDRVYKVEKALYGLHQAPRAWYETLSTYLLENGFQRRQINKTLFIKRDQDGEDVDEHIYRSMISSLMYLTSSRPDIMFFVCVCARFQVNAKVSRLYAVKRIFRYLKGQPKLGLWYPKDSPFDLVAYTDSDYAGASLDRKSITGVRLAKRLTVDMFDDLFDYLQQFKKLVNSSRAKKLEKSHDTLALVAHTGSSSRNTSSYYVTHPTSVVDYDDEYQQDDV